ncbi:hypothetical protein LNTAR_23889 [Lentisphaera araneosa HTCC2155]|uniref:Integrase catalytic domain-containing protein n=1 Tax=Lentisphaera araneosa HTCC2155 TaxID=313628 RepID=A6DU49_9BACT|nr:DDE-type integrase/transposase/recombinase [Lentisphaera araneosa]EDM24845.1 hypothetical protein LNTAR_23889 [Lentisphaera araneosa HTCC2155]
MLIQDVISKKSSFKEIKVSHGFGFKKLDRWRTWMPPQPDLFEFNWSEYLDIERFLEHKIKRTHGSKKFHEALKAEGLSQRQIQERINELREEHHEEQKTRENLKVVKWHESMHCWAMDDTHKFTTQNGTKYWVHNIKDLGSQYLLPPITGPIKTGEEVAQNLKKLFDRFGAPFVLKRDNGANFCNQYVDQVLAEYGVIALTSPPYYSKYNGSIEQSNNQLKKQIDDIAQKHDCPINCRTLSILACLAAHEENCKEKRSLGRREPNSVFFSSFRKINIKTQKQRQEAITAIQKIENKLLNESQNHSDKKAKNTVKRKAIETFLENNGYITTYKEEQLSTLLCAN